MKENKVPEENAQQEVKSEVTNQKKKNTGIKIFLIVLTVLVVAVIVSVVLIFMGKLGKEKTSTEAKQTNTEYKMTGNDLQDFDLSFLKIENKEANKVYSPLSIKYALAMLNEGSDGATKEQLTNVIGDYKSKKYMNSEHLSLANALFVRDTFKNNLQEDYIKSIKTKYDAEVITDSFQNASTINNWTSDKTFKLIDNLMSDADMGDLEYVLVNALAIDMNWNNAIQCASGIKIPCIHYSVNYKHERYSDYVSAIYNEEYPTMEFNGTENIKSLEVAGSFNNYDIVKELGEDKIRETVGKEYDIFLAKGGCGDDPDRETYLNTYIEELNSNYKQEDYSTDFYIYDDDKIKVFAKDLKEYDGTTLQYVGIMPKEEKLTDYIKGLDAKQAQKIISNLKELKADSFEDGVVTKIRGNIPLFNYDYELDLKSDLQAMGIKDVFDSSKSNLSKLSSGEKTFIAKAIHKANIEFSNEGIKASAATAMGGAGAAGCWFTYDYDVPVKEINISFNKPYMYVIRDKASGEVWFAGTVYEPVKMQ